MFGRLSRALKLYRLFGRCEDAFKDGLEKSTMSKTKIGTVLAAIGAAIIIIAKVLNGDMDIMTALPLFLVELGSVVAIFGGRNIAGRIEKALDK